MLITCPECNLPVSDKALSCPHCGLPFKTDAKPRQRTSKKEHKRLPNGFGQISQLKGRNLRKPFRAMVSVGKKSTGRPISKVLGFYETYNDAYMALTEYHKNPYDIDDAITLFELYTRWSEWYFSTLKSKSAARNIIAAWKNCTAIYDMKVKDIRARHIKGCMDETSSPNIKSRIKSMFNIMLDYALEYEIVDMNYARTFSVSDDVLEEAENNKKPHIAFTEEEIKRLWENININYVDIILIQCYSGLRPQEIGLIELDKVNLEQGLMTGGMKTKAGKNRTIPIHDRIYDFVKYRYDEAIELGSKYLFNCTDGRDKKDLMLTYDKYANRFDKIIEVLELNPEHRPHDPRKHFVTMAKKADMDEYAIKYIAGHKIDDITERVYTERKDEWLINEMKKIKE